MDCLAHGALKPCQPCHALLDSTPFGAKCRCMGQGNMSYQRLSAMAAVHLFTADKLN